LIKRLFVLHRNSDLRPRVRVLNKAEKRPATPTTVRNEFGRPDLTASGRELLQMLLSDELC
jgi:hypothetical protein